MELTPISEPHVITKADWVGPSLLGVGPGTACVLSARCPGSDVANEDSLAVIPAGASAVVLVVADGAGGLPAGEEASALAVKSVVEAVQRSLEAGEVLRSGVLDGIEAASQAVRAMGTGSGTTLVVAVVEAGKVRTFHVGDSIALLMGQRGKVKHMTVSHSPVGYGLEAGLLDEQEAEGHAERHIVCNLVGAEDMRIEVGPEIELSPRDTLVIASDGLSDNQRTEDVVETVRTGELGHSMITLATSVREQMQTEGGHADDLSMILFRMMAPPSGD